MPFTVTYAQTSFISIGANSVKPAMLEAAVRANGSIVTSLLRVRCENPGGATTPETENTTSRSWGFVFAGAGPLTSPELTALGGIVTAHTGVEVLPPSRITESGGLAMQLGAVADGQYLRRSGTTIIGATPAGGGGAATQIVETGASTTLDIGTIANKGVLVRDASTIYGAFDIARTSVVRTDSALNVTATTAGTANSIVSFNAITGGKYQVIGTIWSTVSATTRALNPVISGTATLTRLRLVASKYDTGSTARFMWATSKDATPGNSQTTSNATGSSVPTGIDLSFECTSGGSVVIAGYIAGTSGTVTVNTADITIMELIPSS